MVLTGRKNKQIGSPSGVSNEMYELPVLYGKFN